MTAKFGKGMFVALICFAFGMSGYGQSTSPQNRNRTSQTPPTGADQNQTTANPIAKAVESNMAQVQLGKVAADKSENPKVKDFANMMVSEHEDALMKLSSLPGGNSSGVKLNSKHQQLKERLSQLSGAQFDQQYMKAMVTEQQENVKFLEQQSRRSTGSTSGGTDLPSIAKDLLPMARQNLQMAEEIQKELGTAPTSTAPKPGTRSKPTTPDTDTQTPDTQTPDDQK
jgi:putative membrane protein